MLHRWLMQIILEALEYDQVMCHGEPEVVKIVSCSEGNQLSCAVPAGHCSSSSACPSALGADKQWCPWLLSQICVFSLSQPCGQPSLLLQYRESGLSSSSYELSQYIRDGADHYSAVLSGTWSPAQAGEL